MMITFKRVFSLFLGVSVAACSAQDTSIDHEAELAQLEAANESFTGSISAMDLEGIMSWVAEDAIFYPPASEALSGRESVREFFAAAMSDPSASAEFEHLSASLSEDGSMGYTVSMLSYTYTAPDGNVTTDLERDLHIWRKDGSGSWKLVLDMWNK